MPIFGAFIALLLLLGWTLCAPTPNERQLRRELRSVGINGFGLRSGGEGPLGLFTNTKGMPPSSAAAALHLSGTNSLELLKRMFQAKSSPGAQALWELAGRIPYVRKWRSTDSPQDTAMNDQLRAVWAVQQLGSNAAPLLPFLVPLISNPDHSVAAIMATGLLSQTEPDAILQVTNRFRVSRTPFYSTDPIDIAIGHAGALYELARQGSNSAGAAPYFLSFLSSTNSIIRAAAATACGSTRAAPEIVIPRMIADLAEIRKDEQARIESDTHRISTVTRAYVQALAEFGEQASNAIPIVTELLNHGFLETQRTRTALRRMGAAIEQPPR